MAKFNRSEHIQELRGIIAALTEVPDSETKYRMLEERYAELRFWINHDSMQAKQSKKNNTHEKQ